MVLPFPTPVEGRLNEQQPTKAPQKRTPFIFFFRKSKKMRNKQRGRKERSEGGEGNHNGKVLKKIILKLILENVNPAQNKKKKRNVSSLGIS